MLSSIFLHRRKKEATLVSAAAWGDMIWECLLKQHSKAENRWQKNDFLRTSKNTAMENISSVVMRMIRILKMPRQHKRAGGLGSWEQGQKWEFFKDVPVAKNFCEHARQWSTLRWNDKRFFFPLGKQCKWFLTA